MLGWDNFFVAEVGASAALTGLIFVGISISLARIVSFPHLATRALKALVVMLGVLVISSVLLLPASLFDVGVSVLIIGACFWNAEIYLDNRIVKRTPPQYRRSTSLFVAAGQFASLPFPLGGALILAWGSGGIYLLALGTVFSFLYAIEEAWVLLIEINR